MISSRKYEVLGVGVNVVDYAGAVDTILAAAAQGRSFGATALAVHGVMTGADAEHRYRLNSLDMVTPDGQPVRWALNFLHSQHLRERVYGPELMIRLCDRFAAAGLPVFLYGTTDATLRALAASLTSRFPSLRIAGMESSKFRTTSPSEKADIVHRIRTSGARLCFVALGCPRQETFVYEYRRSLPMPLVAVGAAFDYHAGNMTEPPVWVQRWGLQWLHRLAQDPRRLWRRYLLLNPAFVAGVALQHLGLRRVGRGAPPAHELLYG